MFKFKSLYGVATSLIVGLGICWFFILFLSQPYLVSAELVPPKLSVIETAVSPQATSAISNLNILIDDFQPQPIQGDNAYFYNRLGGARWARLF